jgi:hypothetical protein
MGKYILIASISGRRSPVQHAVKMKNRESPWRRLPALHDYKDLLLKESKGIALTEPMV